MVYVLFTLLLNRNIGEMYKHVIKIRKVSVVFDCTKAAKSFFRDPSPKWPVRRHEYVESHVKLFTANQQR